MKKYFAVISALIIAAAFTGCSSEKEDREVVSEVDRIITLDDPVDIPAVGGESNVQIPNPIENFDTLSQAESAAGFTLSLPDEIDGMEPTGYAVIKDANILDVRFGENGVSVRKAQGDSDISGDYNIYSDVRTEDIGGRSAELRGEDGKIFGAVWTDGGFTYSIYSADGLSVDAVTAAVSGIE